MCCIIPHNLEVEIAQFSRYTTYRNNNMKWLSSPHLYRVFLPYSKRGKCLLSNFNDRWQSGGIVEIKLISIMSLVNSYDFDIVVNRLHIRTIKYHAGGFMFQNILKIIQIFFFNTNVKYHCLVPFQCFEVS